MKIEGSRRQELFKRHRSPDEFLEMFWIQRGSDDAWFFGELRRIEKGWRRVLKALIELGLLIDPTFPEGAQSSESSSQRFVRLHVVSSTDLCTAILRLRGGTPMQVGPLMRSLLELMVNLKWVMLEFSDQRAARFFSWRAVERVKVVEKVPEAMWTGPEHKDRVVTPLLKEREALHPSFWKTKKGDPDGERRWRHWAVDGQGRERASPLERFADVIVADEQQRTIFTPIYALLCTMSHVSPHGLACEADRRSEHYLPGPLGGSPFLSYETAAFVQFQVLGTSMSRFAALATSESRFNRIGSELASLVKANEGLRRSMRSTLHY